MDDDQKLMDDTEEAKAYQHVSLTVTIILFMILLRSCLFYFSSILGMFQFQI